jgi:kynurenine 3-monooxygenase
MTETNYRPVWIIGAGLAGALLAVKLAQKGMRVSISEKRSARELDTLAPGRSINLALATRGRAALASAGPELLAAVMADALPMFGRHVHMPDGSENFQSYSASGEQAIYSVHRARLNHTLLEAARASHAAIYFDEKLISIDLQARTAVVEQLSGRQTIRFDLIIGADGAGSILREAIAATTEAPSEARVDFLDHSYKEIHIAPKVGGTEFSLAEKALHIWPRERFMMIALPNPDQSFTATLFLQNDGEISFQALSSPAAIQTFVERYFPDFLSHTPDVVQQIQSHPQGPLGTLYCQRWHYQDCAVILGDAAHAIVPFHGQGMNCAFEDCVRLAELLTNESQAMLGTPSKPNARAMALAEFERDRKPQARAIAEMALENYIEMRDHVADADYRLRKQLEQELARLHPTLFVPRYELVSFHTIGYHQAQAIGRWQSQLLHQICDGLTTLCTADVDRASAIVVANADERRKQLSTIRATDFAPSSTVSSTKSQARAYG